MTVPGSVLYWNKKEKQDRTQAAVQQEGDGMKVRCSGCGAVFMNITMTAKAGPGQGIRGKTRIPVLSGGPGCG